MKLIGGGLGDGVDQPVILTSVFGVGVVSQDTKFVNGIQIRNDRGSHAQGFFDVAFVHHESVGRLSLSAHREVAGIEVSGNGRTGLRT
jgi:hypothetical protein